MLSPRLLSHITTNRNHLSRAHLKSSSDNFFPPAGVVSEDVFLHCHLLPPEWALCGRQLDLFPCQPRGRVLATLVAPHLTLVNKWVGRSFGLAMLRGFQAGLKITRFLKDMINSFDVF